MGKLPKYTQRQSTLLNLNIMSYLSGLFASDGNLPSRREHRNKIVLSTGPKDIDFAHRIANILSEDYVPYITSAGSSCISFSAPDFRKFFEHIGMTPAKTHSLDIDLSKVHKLYFLRGFIDGDGYIRNDKVKQIEIVGASKNFMNLLHINFGGLLSELNNSIYRIRWNTRGSVALANDLPVEDYMLGRKSKSILELRDYNNLVNNARRQESNYVV